MSRPPTDRFAAAVALAAVAPRARILDPGEYEGTGVVVDVSMYPSSAWGALRAAGFRYTWDEADPETEAYWMLFDPAGGEHDRGCDCHDCCEVCCCGSLVRDHSGYDGHSAVGQHSYARSSLAEQRAKTTREAEP